MDGEREGIMNQYDYEPQDQPQEEQPEQTLEDVIELLMAHQKTCEEEGKYVEAEMAMNRVKELKEDLKNRNNQELHYRHQNDLAELEETHITEFNNFNEEWDKHMNNFQIHSAGLIKAMGEKHEKELEEEREFIDKKLGYSYKKSPELLSLISTYQNLAKQKEYKQAHRIQIEAQELEAKEQDKYYNERNKRFEKYEKNLIAKQEKEMESLRKRIIAGENEQKKQRAIDLERMFQRYQNVKKELENSHKKEENSLKKGKFNFNPNITNVSSASQRSHMSDNSSARNVNMSAQKKRPSNVARAQI